MSKHHSPEFAVLAFAVLTAITGCSSGPEAPRATVGDTPTATPAPLPTKQPAGDVAAEAAPVRLAFGPQTQSTVAFVGAKITQAHDGNFERFAGTVELVGEHVEQSRVNVDIEMDSLVIEPARLAGHLRTADFFDVAQYPHTTFRSTAIVAASTGGYTVTGLLAMHGVSKQISFPATIAVSPTGVTAHAEFVINRKDFNIVYPGMPDDLIKDDVTIKLDIRAPRS